MAKNKRSRTAPSGHNYAAKQVALPPRAKAAHPKGYAHAQAMLPAGPFGTASSHVAQQAALPGSPIQPVVQ
jgi:hypothetical protein